MNNFTERKNMDSLKKILYMLNRKQKINLFLLAVIMLIGSFMELIGIAAIMPFVNVVSNPTYIHEKTAYSFVYNKFGFTSDTQFIFCFAIGIIVLFLVKNTYIVLMSNIQFRYIFHNQQRFTKLMTDCYMHQPYLFHVSKNVTVLARNVSADVASMFSVLLNFVQIFNEVVVCGLILFYLLLLDKTITICLLVMLSSFALFFLKVVKKKTFNLGASARKNAYKSGKAIRQAFEGIKEIKIGNREDFYVSEIEKYGKIGAEISIETQTISCLPRPMFEALCFSSLLMVVAIKIVRGVNLAYFIPVLSAFAVSAVRLLPSAGRITTLLNAITYNKAAVNNVYKDILEIEELRNNHVERFENREDVTFSNSIKVEDISFNYPSVQENVLDGISFEIKKNSSVAFIGPSGAGKTTLADIILGLLEPQKGHVYCDDIDIFERPIGWHRIVGYIPQMIYLIDDTIRNNVLFGISADSADEERIWKALDEAQLSEFVKGLEKGLDTVVGERGVKLSGGQRQRIGIARALYNNPPILILDEATSALDNETETAVMESIDALHGSRTMIIIAHRLSTIRNCDYIYEIKDKKISLKDKSELF